MEADPSTCLPMLHIARMLIRRGIARVGIAEALAWVKSDPLFLRPDPDGKLLTTRAVRDAENKINHLGAEGQGKHEPLNGGKEWVIRDHLVGASEEQSKAVHHGNARVPCWVVRVPKEIIWGHGGLWSDNSVAMLAALFRMHFPLTAEGKMAPPPPRLVPGTPDEQQLNQDKLR
jgi:hypothetical protein